MENLRATLATAAAKTQKTVIGAQIVSKTLDTLNNNAPKSKSKSNSGNAAAGYDFQKSVLSSVYSPKGAIAQMKA